MLISWSLMVSASCINLIKTQFMWNNNNNNHCLCMWMNSIFRYEALWTIMSHKYLIRINYVIPPPRPHFVKCVFRRRQKIHRNVHKNVAANVSTTLCDKNNLSTLYIAASSCGMQIKTKFANAKIAYRYEQMHLTYITSWTGSLWRFWDALDIEIMFVMNER